MTHILIAQNELDEESAIITKLVKLENTVSFAPLDKVSDRYEEVLPDLVLINYGEDRMTAYREAENILRLDQTACIFGLTTDDSTENIDHMYKSGVRVVISVEEPKITQKNTDQVIDLLISSCNDLEHERCVGCWKTNRFDKLAKLKIR